MVVSEERFEQLVADALDDLPPELGELIDNVAVLVADVGVEPDLLGLYEGVPLTERDDYGGMVLPDRVWIYRLPICAMALTEADVIEEVRVTVVHEIAHHFGLDDDHLDELGWS